MTRDALAGRTLGHVLAWVVAAASILSVAVLVFVPLAGQLVAQLTWTTEEKDACLGAVAPCAVTAVPFGPWLTAVAVGWASLILVAIVVCWSPRRWWAPTGRVTALRPGVFSTPEWFRLHAVGAALFIPLSFGVTSGRTSTMAFWGMLWGVAIALAAIVLATVCIRRTADDIDQETRVGLVNSYSFWLLLSETRLRARHGIPLTHPAALRAAGEASGRPGLRAAARREAEERRR